MLYHARLNVEYTKINIIAFRMKKQFWRIQRPSIAIGSNVSGDKASTLWNTGYFSCDCPSGSELADYIDDYYYQILYPPVLEQMRLLF
jgi:hypothetical protein